MKFLIHPYAADWPTLTGDELERITRSIKERGQRNPIIVRNSDKVLVDGRNRLAACEAIGVEPTVEYLDLTEDETLDLIADLNGCRRHLNESQRALLAARYVEAKRKVAEADKLLSKGKPEPALSIDSAATVRKTTEDAAKKFNVGEASIYRAKAVEKKSPELAADIKSGKETVNSATEKLATPKKKRKPKNGAPVDPNFDSGMPPVGSESREAGEDDVELLPPPKGVLQPIDKEIDQLHAKLMRAVDQKARTQFKVQGPNHKKCMGILGDFHKAFKTWWEGGKP